MKRVLITGANGYIGARLVKFLSENNFLVSALCFPNAPNDKNWNNYLEKLFIGDILNEDTLTEISNYQYDIIINLISLDHNQCNLFPIQKVMDINVKPTWNLLNKFANTSLKKFIYFSTFQVYGTVNNNKITELNKTNPGNIYGLTHLLSEEICNYYHTTTETDCIVARLSNSYGSPVFYDNNCWWLVINDLCRSAYNNNFIQLKSDGSPQRDFIHSSDLCNAINILINNETKEKLNIYNISSGKTFTILELAHQIKDIFNSRFKKNIDVKLPDNSISVDASQSSLTNRFQIDNSRIIKLGFKTNTSLTKGINEVFDYLEMNRIK